jgi:hypothetical protein
MQPVLAQYSQLVVQRHQQLLVQQRPLLVVQLPLQLIQRLLNLIQLVLPQQWIQLRRSHLPAQLKGQVRCRTLCGVAIMKPHSLQSLAQRLKIPICSRQ